MRKKPPRSAEFKRQYIDPNHTYLSLAQQCQLIGLSRSRWYYEPLGESAENPVLMREIDRRCIKRPFFGMRKVRENFGINRKRAQRLMRLLDLEAVCQQSKPLAPPIRSPLATYPRRTNILVGIERSGFVRNQTNRVAGVRNKTIKYRR